MVEGVLFRVMLGSNFKVQVYVNVLILEGGTEGILWLDVLVAILNSTNDILDIDFNYMIDEL